MMYFFDGASCCRLSPVWQHGKISKKEAAAIIRQAEVDLRQLHKKSYVLNQAVSSVSPFKNTYACHCAPWLVLMPCLLCVLCLSCLMYLMCLMCLLYLCRVCRVCRV